MYGGIPAAERTQKSKLTAESVRRQNAKTAGCGDHENAGTEKRKGTESRAMEKNQVLTVVIEDIGSDGAGIGRADGFPVFIRGTAVGDIAEISLTKVHKTYAYGRLLRVIAPGRGRVDPRCSAAGRCGGCTLQHLSYPAQLEAKRKRVQDCLIRIGGLTEVHVPPVIGMENPWRYRNKTQIPFGADREGKLISGFYAVNSHRIVPFSDCLLAPKVHTEIRDLVLRFLEEYHIPAYQEETGKGLFRHLCIRTGFHTGEIMVCLVINGRKLLGSEVLVRRLLEIPGMTEICLNVNTEKTNVIFGQEEISLYGPAAIHDRIGDLTFRISARSFFQVNPVQTEKLYRTALDFAQLDGSENVWDLYCGAGTISLFLARSAKSVHGVEIVASAVENARVNASENHIDNADFTVGKSEEIFPDRVRKSRESVDVVVVDPPRRGCAPELLEAIASVGPKRIVYVSCDPATLARDLRILCAKGYRLTKVQPVDMFPETSHVETVVLMSKVGVE